MIYIKRYIDKLAVADNKKSKDIVLPIDEARGLRDEIAAMLSDLYNQQKNKPEEVFDVQIKGGNF